MEKRKRKQVSSEEILAYYRAKTKEQEPSDNRDNFRAILNDSKLQEAFDSMVDANGKWNEQGKLLVSKYDKIQLDTSGGTTYFAYGSSQKVLYQFVCYYLMKELYNRIGVKIRDAKESNPEFIKDLKSKIILETKSLKPVIVFASTFIHKLVKTGADVKEMFKDALEIGDGHETLLIIYIPTMTNYGHAMEFFSTQIMNYSIQKNRGDKSDVEHVIILSEANYPEFAKVDSLPIINLTTGKLNTKSPSGEAKESGKSSDILDNGEVNA